MRPAFSSSTCTSDGKDVAGDQVRLTSSSTDAIDASRCFQDQFCEMGVMMAAIVRLTSLKCFGLLYLVCISYRGHGTLIDGLVGPQDGRRFVRHPDERAGD